MDGKSGQTFKRPHDLATNNHCTDRQSSLASILKTRPRENASSGSRNMPTGPKLSIPVVTFTFQPHVTGKVGSTPRSTNEELLSTPRSRTTFTRPGLSGHKVSKDSQHQQIRHQPEIPSVYVPTINNRQGTFRRSLSTQTVNQNLHHGQPIDQSESRSLYISSTNNRKDLSTFTRSTPSGCAVNERSRYGQVPVQPETGLVCLSSTVNRQGTALKPTQPCGHSMCQNLFQEQSFLHPERRTVFVSSFDNQRVASFTQTPSCRHTVDQTQPQTLVQSERRPVYITTTDNRQGRTLSQTRPSGHLGRQNFQHQQISFQPETHPFPRAFLKTPTSGHTVSHSHQLSVPPETVSKMRSTFLSEPTRVITVPCLDQNCILSTVKPCDNLVGNASCRSAILGPRSFTTRGPFELPVKHNNSQDIFDTAEEQQNPPRYFVGKHCLPVMPIAGPWSYVNSPSTSSAANVRPFSFPIRPETTASGTSTNYEQPCPSACEGTTERHTNSPCSASKVAVLDVDVLPKDSDINKPTRNESLADKAKIIYAEPSISEVSIEEFYLSSPESLAPEMIEDWNRLDIAKAGSDCTQKSLGDDIQSERCANTDATISLLEKNVSGAANCDLHVRHAVGAPVNAKGRTSDSENCSTSTGSSATKNVPNTSDVIKTVNNTKEKQCRLATGVETNDSSSTNSEKTRKLQSDKGSGSKQNRQDSFRRAEISNTKGKYSKGRKGKRKHSTDTYSGSNTPTEESKRHKARKDVSNSGDAERTCASATPQISSNNLTEMVIDQEHRAVNPRTSRPSPNVNTPKGMVARELCVESDSQQLANTVGDVGGSDNSKERDSNSSEQVSKTNLFDSDRFLMSPQDLELCSPGYQPSSINSVMTTDKSIDSEPVLIHVNSKAIQPDSTTSMSNLLGAIDNAMQAIRISTEQVENAARLLDDFAGNKDTGLEGDNFLSGLTTILDTGCRINSTVISSLDLFVNRYTLAETEPASNRENSDVDLPCLTQECPLDLRVPTGQKDNTLQTDAEVSLSSKMSTEVQLTEDQQCIVSHETETHKGPSRAIKPCVVNLCRLSSADISKKMTKLVSHSWSALTSVESSIQVSKNGKEISGRKSRSSLSASCVALSSIPTTPQSLDSDGVVCETKKSAHSKPSVGKASRRSSSRVTRRSGRLSKETEDVKDPSSSDQDVITGKNNADDKIEVNLRGKSDVDEAFTDSLLDSTPEVNTAHENKLESKTGIKKTHNSEINTSMDDMRDKEEYSGMKTRGRKSSLSVSKSKETPMISNVCHDSANQNMAKPKESKTLHNTPALPSTSKRVSPPKPSTSKQETQVKRNTFQRPSLVTVTQKLWNRKSLVPIGLNPTESVNTREGNYGQLTVTIQSEYSSNTEADSSDSSATAESNTGGKPIEQSKKEDQSDQISERNFKSTLDEHQKRDKDEKYGDKYSNLSPDTSLSTDEATSCSEMSDKDTCKKKVDENRKADRSVTGSKGSKSCSVHYKRKLALEDYLWPTKTRRGRRGSLVTNSGSDQKQRHSSNAAVRKKRSSTTKVSKSWEIDSSGSEAELCKDKLPQSPPGEASNLHSPDQPQDSTSEEIIGPRKRRGLSNEHRQGCFKLLDRIYNFEWSEPFRLEIRKKQVPDYFKVIKTPMYFRLIACKLRQGIYSCVEEFVNDMRLVFYNCRLYHKPNPLQISPKLLEAANMVEKCLNKGLRKTFPDIDFTGVTGTPYSPENQNRCTSRKRKRKHSSGKTK